MSKFTALQKKLLASVDCESHWLYRFTREIGGGNSLTEQFPETVLDLMDTIPPHTTDSPPFELARVLELIGDVAPEFGGDVRFNRLIDLVEQA